MEFVADLHVHSRYSMATSRDMDIPAMAQSAKRKGIDLLGTGDFTHPAYFESLSKYLKPTSSDLFEYEDIRFVLTAEVSNVYQSDGRTRRMHNLIFVPTTETARGVSTILGEYGRLASDGRPVLSISSYEMLARLLEVDERLMLIPAHIWTPWFALFGSKSGFDSLEECFGDLADRIFAVETGLSSDPPMNERLSSLDRMTLISNSDAHSPRCLGREANLFDSDLSYDGIHAALRKSDGMKVKSTLEFFPEEGKYHLDGHRACGYRTMPLEAKANHGLCPVCGRKLTIGVLHRVEDLADRPPDCAQNAASYRHVIPLMELLAEAYDTRETSVYVRKAYAALTTELGAEFHVLLQAEVADVEKLTDARVALAIERMRRGDVQAVGGYDGVFGVVCALPDSKKGRNKHVEVALSTERQMRLL